jgi:hypothetical protein
MTQDMQALMARLERVEAELQELRAASDPPPVASRSRKAARSDLEPSSSCEGHRGPKGEVGRRRAMRTGLAAAGALVAGAAVLSDAKPAAAGNGGAVILGTYNNGATAPTGIVTTGNAAWGLGSADSAVTDYGDTPAIGAAASAGAGTGSNGFKTGVKAIANGDSTLWAIRAVGLGGSNGLSVSTATGRGLSVLTTDGPGVVASTTGGTGISVALNTDTSPASGITVETGGTGDAGAFDSVKGRGLFVRGGTCHVFLDGQNRPAPTGSPTQFHDPGELVEDASGNLWLCVAQGGPGTWRKLGGPATAGAFHALKVPVRVYDSRPGTAPSQGPKTPLPANTARSIDLTVNSSTVPKDATAVAVNVLLVNATAGNGNFTIWANGAARPLANTLVWGGSAGRFSTFAITAVDAAGKAQVYGSLKTDLTVDVVGYYR